MKKYYIKTFGCQMNYSDSERIASFLEARKFISTENIKSADLVIFNTCGVRQMAEDRVYGQVHNLKAKPCLPAGRSYKLKPKIILTGCLAERKDVQRRLKNKVDLFFAIKDMNVFENFIKTSPFGKGGWGDLKTKLMRKNPSVRGGHLPLKRGEISRDYLSIAPKHNNNHSAFVPVMTGCNNFCSYCVVPYARGREVSRSEKEIVIEIKTLIQKGYKLITLLGQNVNSYQDNKVNFPKLLKKINAIPGNFWITFLTSHPKDMSDELIETIAQSKKVCEAVHFPIQAGDDEILQKMNRKYTSAHYLQLVAKIKKAFARYKPNALYSIAGDIIVGFPGETRKQFLESAKIMEKVGYDMIYFGQFSPRYGTVAAKMKDNVSKKEKVRRENYLNEILKITALGNNQKYLNTTLDVLIESKKEFFKAKPWPQGLALKNTAYFGRTRTMKNIKLPATKKNLIGKIVKVKITRANVWNLEGKLS